MQIVELHPQDIEKCKFWTIGEKLPRLSKEITDGTRKMFAWLEKGKYIGGASIVFDNGDLDRTIPNKRAYLSYLVVDEGYRNNGIGSALINYITTYATKLGMQEITLKVDQNNIWAKKLYLKKGFNTILSENKDSLLLLKKLI